MKNYKFKINNLDCANCARKIEEKLSLNSNYENVIVNFSTLTLSFQSNKNINKTILEKEIQKIEKDISLDENLQNNYNRRSNDIYRLLLGLLIFGISLFITNQYINLTFIILSTIILLYKVFFKALKQLKNKIMDENFLITISVIGAMLVGKVHEGIMVITLYEIGKILESKAVNKSRKSISELMDIKVDYANVKINDELVIKKVEEVNIDDIVIVKIGEKIPLDGVIISGHSSLDNSSLTGESRLIKVNKDDKVMSGAINLGNILEIKVTNIYEDSTVYKILELVQNATDKKAKTENFVSKAAKIYTPSVFVFALLFSLLVPLFTNNTFAESIYKALVFLVISCPCSIAISVPLAYFSGIGAASSRGILIKGSNYLDSLKDVNQIIFDKTGTITTGKFSISKIMCIDENYTQDELLKIAAYGESLSNHPIALAILKSYDKKIFTNKITNFKEISGKGISYNLNNDNYKVGNANFIKIKNIESSNTVIYISKNSNYIGYIMLEDEIKEGVKETIDYLNNQNIKTTIFTGDKKEFAQSIAHKIGIKDIKFELLPQDKYKLLEKYINKNIKTKKTIFVGDGINDAPSLDLADIGISMGTIGSSSAIEASDIVIMQDDIGKIPEAISISKKTNRIIKQNLIFVMSVKLLVLLLSALGFTDMWEAVFADVGTTIITILNTLRILRQKV